MDAGGESREIRVHGANDDAAVIRMEAVNVDKVLAVVGDHGALVCTCVAEDFLIGNGFVGFTCVECREHVMAVSTQCYDDRERKVFVSIEPSNHASSPLAAIWRSISSRWLRA